MNNNRKNAPPSHNNNRSNPAFTAKNTNKNTSAGTDINNATDNEPQRKQTRAQRYFEEGNDFFLSGFGSSFNALGTAGSDLDLTLIYPKSFIVDIQDLIQKVRKLFFKSKSKQICFELHFD